MDKPQTRSFWRGLLPHWEVVDGRYFVTVHLRGAIPESGRRRIREIREKLLQANGAEHEALKLRRAIFKEMEDWLERAPFEPQLQHPEVAAMIMEAIDHRVDAGIWRIFSFVIMPNHLHLFCQPREDRSLKSVMEGFKTWTGKEAAGILEQPTNRFWQREWFDHWSRSPDEDERIKRYIRHNPVKAGLVKDAADWPYGDWSK